MDQVHRFLVFGLGLGTAACGSTPDHQPGPPDVTRRSQAWLDSVTAAQRPLLDSSRAYAAQTEFRSPTLLAFGFQPDPIADSLIGSQPGPSWTAKQRLGLERLARELGVRFVTAWQRPIQVFDPTTNAIYDLRAEPVDVGVLILKPGMAPAVLSSGASLASIRSAARRVFSPGRGTVPRA